MSRLVAATAILLSACAMAEDSAYENIGMGGGGGIFAPGISGVDPNFILTCSDMSGCYRTDDCGQSWRMINFKQINSATECKPFFHNKNVNVAVWKDKVTLDKGWTWQPIAKGNAPWGGGPVTHVACWGEPQPAFYVGTAGGLWGSTDGAQTWKPIGSGACGGVAILPDGTAYAAVGSTLYRWTVGKSEPAASGAQGLSGNIAAVAAGGTADAHAVHVVAGGAVYSSTDSGKTFKQTRSGGMLDVVMAVNQTAVAYAREGNQRIHVTKDSGATWTSCFEMSRNVEPSWVQTELKWGYAIMNGGLNVCPTRPEFAVMSTQGDIYVTRDAGGKWAPVMNKRVGNAPGGRGGLYQGIGLEVTTTWDYCFDPWDPNRHYICYTDIGFAYSTDRGKTWSYGGSGSPWANTWYGIEFDPLVKGRIYGACSNKHDIPQWTHCDANYRPGGVVVSEDSGASWKPISQGLPQKPCCGVAVDRKASKPGATVVYVTMYGDGVWKSTDSGATWTKKPGVGRAGNYHVYQVRVHPKSGNVYVGTTANRSGTTFTPNGGLWKSTDGGETWTEITTSLPLGWPTGFAVHPDNEGVIYFAAGSYPGPGGDQGGVYKTSDGGATWKHVLKNSDCPGYVQGMFVELHPDDPNVVYFGGTRGLFASPNGGDSWRLVDEVPFSNCHRTRIDPNDKKTMYVSGFGGGIWRGPVVRGVQGEKEANLKRPGASAPSTTPATAAPKTEKPPAKAPVNGGARQAQAPAGPTEAEVAAAKKAEESLRKAVTDGVAAGKREQVYIDLMGRPARAQVTGASDDGIEVQSSGMQSAIKWSALSPRRFYGVAKRYSEDHKALAAYCRGNGLAEEAAEEERSQ